MSLVDAIFLSGFAIVIGMLLLLGRTVARLQDQVHEMREIIARLTDDGSDPHGGHERRDNVIPIRRRP